MTPAALQIITYSAFIALGALHPQLHGDLVLLSRLPLDLSVILVRRWAVLLLSRNPERVPQIAATIPFVLFGVFSGTADSGVAVAAGTWPPSALNG